MLLYIKNIDELKFIVCGLQALEDIGVYPVKEIRERVMKEIDYYDN